MFVQYRYYSLSLVNSQTFYIDTTFLSLKHSSSRISIALSDYISCCSGRCITSSLIRLSLPSVPPPFLFSSYTPHNLSSHLSLSLPFHSLPLPFFPRPHLSVVYLCVSNYLRQQTWRRLCIHVMFACLSRCISCCLSPRCVCLSVQVTDWTCVYIYVYFCICASVWMDEYVCVYPCLFLSLFSPVCVYVWLSAYHSVRLCSSACLCGCAGCLHFIHRKSQEI